jgi:hypothetical protein
MTKSIQCNQGFAIPNVDSDQIRHLTQVRRTVFPNLPEGTNVQQRSTRLADLLDQPLARKAV